MLAITSLLFIAATLAFTNSPGVCNDSFVVSTASGRYAGLVDEATPNVRQWRSIPFGLPPVGELRWLPPVAVPASNDTQIQDATQYPPSCPQYLSSSPSLWSTLVPEFVINTIGQNTTAGAYADSSAEDCLYLAVWAPTTTDQKLPVIMFMTGGGFGHGGIDISYQIPAQWVQRTQSHVVVTINYRLGIIGFPGAVGLDDVNVGLLDQRVALGWVRANIEAFGGDPEKITLWGQSVGAASAEFQSFIKYQDPIARGYIMTSGSFGLGFTSPPDSLGLSFSTVATELGCENTTSPASKLDCMRQIPVDKLVTVASTISVPHGFFPIQDNKTVFTNYPARYMSGQFAQKPAIYSYCANDGTAFIPFPSNSSAVNVTAESLATQTYFTCPAAQSSKLRSAFTKFVYRYESAANFTNVSPATWLGAYHDSDLAYIFGTDGDFRGPSTAYESEVSRHLQDMILAFMQDPTDVPGWPVYESGKMLRFGADGGPATQVISQAEVDVNCGQCPEGQYFMSGGCTA